MMTLYEKVQPLIKSGDAITWRGTGLISWGISFWSYRTHASLVIRPPDYEGFKGRRWLVEAWEGEVNTRFLSNRLTAYDSGGMAWWHPLRDELEPFREGIATYVTEMVGKKYDYAGLFGNMFGRVSADARKYFCSELVGDAYRDRIPNLVWITIPSNASVGRLLRGIALRPAGIARLPIFKPEVRIL